MDTAKRELTQAQQVERSLHKRYRKTIWKPFVAGVNRYKQIEEGDNIAVCISGGKDSMLLAKLMQALHKISHTSFNLKFIVMDPGYNEINRQRVISNAAKLEVPIEIFESNIFDVITSIDQSPCYLCARMRRGHLYSYAKEIGCNKIALGHHFSDVIETTLIGMFYGAQIQTMMPKVRSQNFEGMELIRPMYCVHEDMILDWAKYNGLEFIQCACPLSESCNMFDSTGGASKRQEVKALLKKLRQENKNIEKNIFQSLHAVKLDTVLAYKQGGVEYSFLDRY